MFLFRMAVDFAVQIKAEKLILNHFSQRYRSEKDESYNNEEATTDQILLTDGRVRAVEVNMADDFVDIARDLQVFNVFRRKKF